MNRRRLLFSLAALAWPGAPRAGTTSEDIVEDLREQGFEGVSVETTWLGRVRILATRQDGQREIVLNPRTGEILRDVWTGSGRSALLREGGTPAGGAGPGATAANSGGGSGITGGSSDSGSGGSGGGSGNSGSGSHHDDDDKDDDREDDREDDNKGDSKDSGKDD